MAKYYGEIPNHIKDKIFGVTEASKSATEGMELRYTKEIGKAGDPDYIRQRVLRSKDGSYYLLVDGGKDAAFDYGNGYPLRGRVVMIPVMREALIVWAENGLRDGESKRAMKEFRLGTESFDYKTVWQYEHGNIYELLWKLADDLYALLSIDRFYPYPSHNIVFDVYDEEGIKWDFPYLYYISPLTASRWAEIRGMDERTYHTVFGRCASC